MDAEQRKRLIEYKAKRFLEKDWPAVLGSAEGRRAIAFLMESFGLNGALDGPAQDAMAVFKQGRRSAAETMRQLLSNVSPDLPSRVEYEYQSVTPPAELEGDEAPIPATLGDA